MLYQAISIIMPSCCQQPYNGISAFFYIIFQFSERPLDIISEKIYIFIVFQILHI